MEEKMLGKIASVSFGRLCGRSDQAFGLRLSFSCGSVGCNTDLIISVLDDYDLDTAKVDELPDSMLITKISTLQTLKLIKILHAAKVRDVTQLKNVPVELTFVDGCLADWRILTEVL